MSELRQTPQDVVYFGRIDFRNRNRLFGVKRRDRRQHMYVVGKTGTGKTALLHNLVVQDIINGEGLCVIDPHGEFVESLLEKIPKERVKDIVYFNPSDPDYHLGYNPLELVDPLHKHLIASGLMAIFTKIWANVWSARMEYIMNNAILALLETPGSTLLGITRILVDKDFRQKIVANIKDPVVKAFWVNEYESWRDQFRNEAIAPIQNKVGQFLSTALIRNVVGQSKSTINIFDIMNTRKIFLVNVSKGRIGEDNSALLGAMLITTIQLAAMERVRIPEEERADFYLYVDEFQNFATDSFAGILSEARKYRLNLILAHQYIGQLVTDVSTKVRDAVFGNVGTMILFRVGAADAEFLENEFTPEFVIQDIVNLPNYCVYLKLMCDGVTSRPFSASTLPPFKVPGSSAHADEIIESSRRLYARPRQVIEDEVNRWSGMMGDMSSEESPSAPRSRETFSSEAGMKYGAVCSACGKSTTLNFKPTEGRPVYCRECLMKIKSGEMAPVRINRVQAPKIEKKFLSDLANMGIEFETPSGAPVGAGAPERAKYDVRPSSGPRPPRRFVEVERRADSVPEKHISLTELSGTPKEKESLKPKKHHEIDIEELRKAVKSALHTSVASTGSGDEEKRDDVLSKEEDNEV